MPNLTLTDPLPPPPRAFPPPPRARLEVGVAALAAGRHGVVARRELLRLGATASTISRWLAWGRLHVVFRGVYVVGSPDLTPVGRCAAALLAGGPGAALSHRSAAAVWGLSSRWPSSVDVVASSHRRARRGLRLHEGTLEPGDVRTQSGLRVTSPARTLVDLADVVTPTALELAVATAERLGLIDLTDLRVPRAGRRRVIDERPVFTRSSLERTFLGLVRAWGLPVPLGNQVIGPYEADFLWPAASLIVELDSFATHGDRVAFERDRRKSGYLEDRGFRVRRITDERLKADPAAVEAELRRLLSRG